MASHTVNDDDFAPAARLVLTRQESDGRPLLLMARGRGRAREYFRCPLASREESDAWQIGRELARLEWDELHDHDWHRRHHHRHAAQDLVVRVREVCQ